MRTLAQFDRETLEPGHSMNLTLHIGARQLSHWSEAKQKWILDAGGRTIYVGDADASRRLPLHTTLTAPGRATLTCADQQINGTTIAGNLLVPSGQWCDLVDVTVHGNLRAQAALGLRVARSTITGNLIAQATQRASDPLSAGTNVICRSTIRGSLRIEGSGPSSRWSLGSCGANTVRGSVTVDSSRARTASRNARPT